ncbi:OLC1v1029252C1 [Oldenlandia corymbosa var. corymbosa]|uniref:OLC1v1029252C1 n=1 Tax=Oldenlandia corymbosa var. corymbosa TaxID=529605 RepID=A0AAV1CDJ6_OLDCO|nr:OLC1v1029252C1 [Oldenlandia corymbosa var. corymbosa]
MTDRVYPSGKPNGTAAATTGATNPAAATNPPQFPPPKSQLYNPMRHPYRPNPALHARHNHRRCSCRRCFCLCCFWSVLVFLILLLLLAIAGAALYVLYRPHRPAFSISSLKLSTFNLTTSADDTTRITTKLNFTLSSKNPNKKITFYYNPISINLYSSQVLIANGTFTNFTSPPGDVNIAHSILGMTSEVLDVDSVKSLRSDLKRRNGLPMRIEMETKMKVKVEKLNSKKVGIKIVCDGVHGMVPKGNSTAVASSNNAKCKVDLKIKIWKFNF